MKFLLIFFTLISLSIAHTHPHGESLMVQKFIKARTPNGIEEVVFVDYEKLYSLFDHPEIKDRKIVAFSIIGAYRRGKSFFLDYCLRYLYANYKSINTQNSWTGAKSDWIGSPDEPLTGFSWKPGMIADTKGILFWSDIFLYDAPNGDKIAIIIMDTQGLFEPGISADFNSRIFGLSTLISSMQVINLNGVIQEDQLQYLEMSVEFTKLVQKRSKFSRDPSRISRPFQDLIFLIRDWADENTGYGYEGGKITMRKIEKAPKYHHNPAAENVRRNIKSAFDKISTFLLPHPGLEVTKNNFDGSYKNLDSEFVENLKILIESIFAPRNLVVKKVFGHQVKGEEFKNLVLDYFDAFNSTQLPKIESVYQVTVKRELRKVVDELVNEYAKELQQSIDFDVDFTTFERNFNSKNYEIKLKTIQKFRISTSTNDEEIIREMTEVLSLEIDDLSSLLKENALKYFAVLQEHRERIERLNLEKNEANQRLSEERRKFQAEMDEWARKMAARQNEIREAREKEKRYNWMKIIGGLITTVLSFFG